jgi:hypothetical protein
MVLILSDKREFVGHPVHELNSTPNTTLESLAGVGKEISDKCHSDPELLAECVIGASLKEQYINLFAEVLNPIQSNWSWPSPANKGP